MASISDSKWRSIRFWLPMLLAAVSICAGLSLFVVEKRTRERELEAGFERNLWLRANRVQADVERWMQRNDLEMVQSIFAELGVIPEIKSAVFLNDKEIILASTRRGDLGQRLPPNELGLPHLEPEKLAQAMREAHQNARGVIIFTNDHNGLASCFPAILPLQPGELEMRRGGMILMSDDITAEKMAGMRHLRWDFLTYFGGILGSALLLGGSLHFLITRRLEALKTAMTDFAAGRPARGGSAQLGDEISELETHFQEMAASIRKAMGEMRRLNRELRAISSCNQVLMRASDESQILEEICRIVCLQAGYAMAWVGYAGRDDSKTLQPVASFVSGQDQGPKAGPAWEKTEPAQRAIDEALSKATRVYLQECQEQPTPPPQALQAGPSPYRSLIAMPLNNEQGTPFGLFMIFSTEANIFTPDEIRLLEELAGDLAFGINILRGRKERTRNEALMAARLHLIEFSETHSLEEVLEETLNQAENISESKIGFYHFVDEDQVTLSLQNWSARTKAEFCKAEGKGLHYPIDQAGVWIECVSQKKPVIHNDYATLSHRKGLPEGHAEVIRELVVPVLRGDKIKAILGVGNKSALYSEDDIKGVELLADLAWEIARRKRTGEALRQSEENLRKLNLELEQRVLIRTKELAESAEQLRQHAASLEATNKELESFSYSVSHDLRAPLRSIDGFSKALLEDYSEQLDEEGKEYLRIVRSASQRMAQLIDDILQLSRITRASLNLGKVNLSALATEVVQEFKSTEPEREVETSIEPDCWALADGNLLRIVLENLIGNAWKFTGKTRAPKIAFGKSAHNGVPVYYVRDNGVGFEMQYANKLFGAFQRLHTNTEFPGTGIGLASSQRILHRHGGEIWIEGKIDQGATVYFSLPQPERNS